MGNKQDRNGENLELGGPYQPAEARSEGRRWFAAEKPMAGDLAAIVHCHTDSDKMTPRRGWLSTDHFPTLGPRP